VEETSNTTTQLDQSDYQTYTGYVYVCAYVGCLVGSSFLGLFLDYAREPAVYLTSLSVGSGVLVVREKNCR
jgi:hypothetical protein